MRKVEDFFYVKRGKGGYIKDFDKGETPLVSATTSNNGIIAFVNDAPKFKAPIITVERVKGTAFVQPIDFSTVPDDISVLVPKAEMPLEMLYVVASIINKASWRFSFARKLTPTRLKKIGIPIDSFTDIKLPKLENILPEKDIISDDIPKILNHRKFEIRTLFDVITGEIHSVKKLKHSDIPLISCSDKNNGIAGYYKINERLIHQNKITVAYDGQPLTAKYHPYQFATYDNVGTLIPKRNLKLTTLLFTMLLLDREKWRYSYGRKCYREKLSHIELEFPVKSNDTIDENLIEQIVTNTTYWRHFKTQVLSLSQPTQKATINSFFPN